jgi:hypothetical protein
VPAADGFAEDMTQREEKVRQRMEEPSSDESGWDEED